MDENKNEPFEFQFMSATLVRYSLRENHIAILNKADFEEKFEILPDEPPAQS